MHLCTTLNFLSHSRCKDLYLECHPSAINASRLTVSINHPVTASSTSTHTYRLFKLLKSGCCFSCGSYRYVFNKRSALYRAIGDGQELKLKKLIQSSL